MPIHDSTQNYLALRVQTARPEELRLMLLDGAIKFATQGREGLARKDFEGAFNGFSRARNILVELINSTRPDADPELCRRVNGVLTFIYTRLIESSLEKKPELADEAIELLRFERDTWAMLLEKLAAERAGAIAAANQGAAEAAPGIASLCVQG